MRQNLQTYIDERAKDLAFISLVRNPEFQVDRHPSNDRLDLLVMVHQDATAMSQVFGVVVRGKETALRDRHATVAEFDQGNITHGLALPVCFVLFSMADDCGYYKWNDRPNEPWQDLNVDGMPNLLQHLTAWYEANIVSAA
jgi:hypothetical protein